MARLTQLPLPLLVQPAAASGSFRGPSVRHASWILFALDDVSTQRRRAIPCQQIREISIKSRRARPQLTAGQTNTCRGGEEQDMRKAHLNYSMCLVVMSRLAGSRSCKYERKCFMVRIVGRRSIMIAKSHTFFGDFFACCRFLDSPPERLRALQCKVGVDCRVSRKW